MQEVDCWLTSSNHRVFAHATAPAPRVPVQLAVARGERFSFQACLRNNRTQLCEAGVSLAVPAAWRAQVRRVGVVPMPHHTTDVAFEELDGTGAVPGLIPDPLYPATTAKIGPFETQSFWIVVHVPPACAPGAYPVRVSFDSGASRLADELVVLEVFPLQLQKRRDFPSTHWFYADALCDWYQLRPYEEPFWPLVERYMRNLVEHDNNCQYVPLFTPPTDGVKRATQLLRVTSPAPGRYAFDFTDVQRWTELALRCGAEYFEWTHLFTQWGVKNALRVYRNNADPHSLLWPPETGATSDTYRQFLAQFLPAFKRFLDDNGYLPRSFFHLSDEPHGDEHLANYRAARELLRELAPWMRVLDALSDIRFAREGLTDTPIPVLSAARDFAEAGIPAWTYFCCGPRGRFINRFCDTPLATIRMLGMAMYRLKAQGFLHWGYNYWYKSQSQQMIDPFCEAAGGAWPGWGWGDPFVVYPGPDGPLDSIRWEAFGEGLQDYALLQSAGIDPDDPLLADIKGYDDFPRDENAIYRIRQAVLQRHAGR